MLVSPRLEYEPKSFAIWEIIFSRITKNGCQEE